MMSLRLSFRSSWAILSNSCRLGSLHSWLISLTSLETATLSAYESDLLIAFECGSAMINEHALR